jgi:hypothetical protein
LHTGASSLLAAYCELHGRQLSAEVVTGLAAVPWAAPAPPSAAPHALWDTLLSHLAAAQAEVEELLGALPRSGALPRLFAAAPLITETNRIHFVLLGMHNRIFGPYLAVRGTLWPCRWRSSSH